MENYLGTIWFVLWGVLWAVYFILDGYDFGAHLWKPLLGYHENDRDSLYAATGTFWDGNEVWLITAGGVTFAAFPEAYAAMFSGLYIPLMALLFCLILRGVVYEFRAQLAAYKTWRLVWDAVMFGVSFLIPLLLGVAFANIFKGLPLDENHHFVGNILILFNPYGLVGGLLFVFMFMAHGALFLAINTPAHLAKRALECFKLIWPIFILVFLVFVIMSFTYVGLQKNYFNYPVLLLIPGLSVVGFIFSAYNMYFKNKPLCAFAGSSVGILFLTLCGVIGMYPNLLPSSIDPAYSVNIANGASSPKTLGIMLIVVLIFVPLVIFYQFWTHKTFINKPAATDH